MIICKEIQSRIRNLFNITDVSNLSDNKNVSWRLLSKQPLTESFIRDFQDCVYWSAISYYQSLSESFIREFQDKVAWESISIKQKLSENFIEEFQYRVDWYNISISQKLSKNFILNHKKRLYLLVMLSSNSFISEDDKSWIRNYIQGY